MTQHRCTEASSCTAVESGTFQHCSHQAPARSPRRYCRFIPIRRSEQTHTSNTPATWLAAPYSQTLAIHRLISLIRRDSRTCPYVSHPTQSMKLPYMLHGDSLSGEQRLSHPLPSRSLSPSVVTAYVCCLLRVMLPDWFILSSRLPQHHQNTSVQQEDDVSCSTTC